MLGYCLRLLSSFTRFSSFCRLRKPNGLSFLNLLNLSDAWLFGRNIGSRSILRMF